MSRIYPQGLARLAELTTLVREGRATPEQRDEFMGMMHRSGRITNEQMKLYEKDRAADLVVRSALLVAGLVLVAYLVDKLTE